MYQAVFLDRDGVINQAIIKNGRPYPPKDLSELVILPGVNQAISLLRSAGFLLIGITNQPDVARGITRKEDVMAINDYLIANLLIDDILTCYHDDDDKCSCRKPLPGMILKAAKEFKINLKKSYMVGDRWRDIKCGLTAGTSTIFIDYKYKESRPDNYTYKVQSLYEAAVLITGKNDE